MIRLKELIQNHDYDYIEFRYTMPGVDGKTIEMWDTATIGEKTLFFGSCKSENGKLISLDGDIYDENEEILYHEGFTNEKEGVKDGLSIILQGKWSHISNK